MSQPLFRKQVMSFQGERLWGDLILSQSVSYWFISLFIGFISLLALLYLFSNSYSRKQAVTGYLVPDRGLITVYPPRSGLLSRLEIEQNDKVKAGELLFEIQVDTTSLPDGLVTEQVLSGLERQRQGLIVQIDLEQQRYQSLILQSEQKENRFNFQISHLEQLIENEKHLLVINQNALTRANSLLSKGMLSIADYERVNAEVLKQNNVVKQLILNRQETKFELGFLANEKDGLLLSSLQNITVLESDIDELNKQKIQLNAERSNAIISPLSGSVSSINVQPGQMLSAQYEVLSIIPENSILEAELYVPSRAIAFIEENQQVNIRYEAYPYQKFGVQKAKVIEISKSIILPSELPAVLSFNEPVYRVVASLEFQTVSAYGVQNSLKPGMVFSADVMLEKRSLLEWLLEPLFSIKGRV